MSKKITFPKDFLWGGAVSAEQTEGKGTTPKARTVYDMMWDEDRDIFYKGYGPQKTTETMTHYKEDVKMWKELGINSHRTSISWARIFPNGMDAEPSKEGIRWYHDFIDEMLANGIKPIINLYHFDMPEFAQVIGGFENRLVWDWFEQFCKVVYKEFIPKVKMWTTMNEPWVPIHVGYLNTLGHPQIVDSQRASNAAYGIIMCHAKAVNYFNDVMKKEYPEIEIGAIFNSAKVYPRDENNPEDVKAALYSSLYQTTGLTDPMVLGKWRPEMIEWIKEMDLVPECYRKEDIEELAKVSVDFVGLNFYAPARAMTPTDEDKKSKNKFLHYFSPYDKPDRRENKFRGWEIYPEGIYDTLMMYADRYGKDKKYMLTEYGMGVQNESRWRDETGIIQDNYRIAFVQEHLEQLQRAMEDGLNIIGAHMWATHDCWSWANSFKNTYGLIEVDLETMERKPKSSALWMKEMIENGGFDDDYKKMEEYMNFDEQKIEKSLKAY